MLLEKIIYDSCKNDIEMLVDAFLPLEYTAESAVSLKSALFWLYGELDNVFIYRDLSIIDIDYDGQRYYMKRLVELIADLEKESRSCQSNDWRQRCLFCAKCLEKVHDNLAKVKTI